MHVDKLPYRPCVGIMLLNGRGEAFVAQRIDQVVEAWQMPQGGIDDGEDPLTAALRELEEEIGVTSGLVQILAESQDWHFYDLPEALVGKVWKGRFRGQKQKWYAAQFLGQDADITLETADPEFNQWRWLAPDQLPAMIVPFKRAIYEALVREFAPVISALRTS